MPAGMRSTALARRGISAATRLRTAATTGRSTRTSRSCPSRGRWGCCVWGRWRCWGGDAGHNSTEHGAPGRAGFEVLGDGGPQAGLGEVGVFAGVERDEVVVSRHLVELVDQRPLVGDERVVQVVAVVHVHPRF